MRIARMVVLVTDQERALAFYRDALGFRVLDADGHVIVAAQLSR